MEGKGWLVDFVGEEVEGAGRLEVVRAAREPVGITRYSLPARIQLPLLHGTNPAALGDAW